MATHNEINESLQAFQDSYKANPKLQVMNKDWDRTVWILADDVESAHTMSVKAGVVSLQEGKIGQPDLTVMANSDILADMFFGDITPTEPYLSGELKIIGSEDDILRLDIISLLIWGE